MSRSETNPETISRGGAIDLLRRELVKLADDDSSICKVAAERGIFCHGFKRFGDAELKRRFGWLNRKNPLMERAEFEELVNCWQLARQQVDHLPTSCDVQQREHDGCRGWDDFSNDELSAFCKELTGRSVVVN